MAASLARDAQEHEEEVKRRFNVPLFPYLRHWADSLPFLPVPKSRSFSCVTALHLQTLSNGHPVSSVFSGSTVILRILRQLS